MKTEIINGDALTILRSMADESVDCIITSPPYWQKRDYGVEGQIGLEPSFRDYLGKLLAVFQECKRVLKESGSMWINIADSYSGYKNGITDRKMAYIPQADIRKRADEVAERSLMGTPARLEIALIDSGLILRNRIVWHKDNVMPSSCPRRFTIDYEDVFWFVKTQDYYFVQQKEPFQAKDEASIKAYLGGNKIRNSQGIIGGNEIRKSQTYIPKDGGMRNVRTTWTINPSGITEAHYATFPEELPRRMIQATCPKDGIVMDPFAGSGTTGIVAKQEGRDFIGIELNTEYATMAERRISKAFQQMGMEL